MSSILAQALYMPASFSKQDWEVASVFVSFVETSADKDSVYMCSVSEVVALQSSFNLLSQNILHK